MLRASRDPTPVVGASWLVNPEKPPGRYRRLPQQFDNASLLLLNRHRRKDTGNGE
jgi:hypothetical protein